MRIHAILCRLAFLILIQKRINIHVWYGGTDNQKMKSAEYIRKQRCNGTLHITTTQSLSLLKNAGPEWCVVDVWIFDFRRHYLR